MIGKAFASVILFMFSVLAFAEDAHHAAAEAHGDAHGAHDVVIPWGSLFVQTFNVVVLLAILIYVLRKPAVEHFKNRASEYDELVRRAESAKLEAERGHREIKDRLDKLEATSEQSLVEARREADAMKARVVSDAKAASERLLSEAQRTVANEVEKAKAELRHELLQSALATSQEVLKSSLGASEQKKLQNEFVTKIQVVGQ